MHNAIIGARSKRPTFINDKIYNWILKKNKKTITFYKI